MFEDKFPLKSLKYENSKIEIVFDGEFNDFTIEHNNEVITIF
jgi:hypothetical protein